MHINLICIDSYKIDQYKMKIIVCIKYLINKRHGSQGLKLEIDSTTAKHTSYKEVYFNEFVQSSLGGNMDMMIFDLRGYGGC